MYTYLRVPVHDDHALGTQRRERPGLPHDGGYPRGHAGAVFLPRRGRVVDRLRGGAGERLGDEVDEGLRRAEARGRGGLAGAEDVDLGADIWERGVGGCVGLGDCQREGEEGEAG